MKILITGATGMVGSAFGHLYPKRDLIKCPRAYDLRDPQHAQRVMQDTHPDAIIHLAAKVISTLFAPLIKFSIALANSLPLLIVIGIMGSTAPRLNLYLFYAPILSSAACSGHISPLSSLSWA